MQKKYLKNLFLVLFLLIFNISAIKIIKEYELKVNTYEKEEYLKNLVTEIEKDYDSYYKKFYSNNNTVSLTMNFDTLEINQSNINKIIDRRNKYQKELNILNDILKIKKDLLCKNLNSKNTSLTKELSLKKDKTLNKINKTEKFSLDAYLKENHLPKDPCNYLIEEIKLKKKNLESDLNYFNNKIASIQKEIYERDERLRITLYFLLTIVLVIIFIYYIRKTWTNFYKNRYSNDSVKIYQELFIKIPSKTIIYYKGTICD